MIYFMKALGEVWRCANLYRTGKYGELGLGSYQDSYILNICRQPGITQEQLSRLIYVHKSSVARQLGALEEKGFITRTPDPDDKRSLLVYPTQKALDALPFIREVHAKWNALILSGFSPQEQKDIEKYVKRLAENAKRVLEGEQLKPE